MKGRLVTVMETYILQKPAFDDVKPFKYIYPNIFETKYTTFHHIGFGLYLAEVRGYHDIDEINNDIIKIYPNIAFLGFYDSVNDKAEILFAYSKKYSTWDEDTLREYIACHTEEFNIKEELKSNFSYAKRECKFKYLEIFEYCDITENSAYDLKFEFNDDSENYILVNGKVGTKIHDKVFEFKDNLKYRYKSVCAEEKVYQPYVTEGIVSNGDYSILYTSIWSGGSISILTENRISYIALEKDNDFLIKLNDYLGLEYKSFEKNSNTNNKVGLINIEEILSNLPKKDINEKDIIEADAKPVFNINGFKGDWRVIYKEIFNFSNERVISASYLYFINDELVALDYEGNAIIRIPLNLVKYLRVTITKDCETIGHTFVDNIDEIEYSFASKYVVDFLKDVSNSSSRR